MPRKNQFGKYILSAGEISTYTVCPEAWRLAHIEQKDSNTDTKVSEGSKVHDQWSSDVQTAVSLARHKILIVILIGLLVVFYLLRYSIR